MNSPRFQITCLFVAPAMPGRLLSGTLTKLGK
jgi:hypothetical protein